MTTFPLKRWTGKRLRELRGEMNQDTFAELIGWDRSKVGREESKVALSMGDSALLDLFEATRKEIK